MSKSSTICQSITGTGTCAEDIIRALQQALGLPVSDDSRTTVKAIPKQTKVKRPSKPGEQLSSRDRLNLATDVVNASLKVLSEHAKTASEAQRSGKTTASAYHPQQNSVSKTTRTPKDNTRSSDVIHLVCVARCSVVAFSHLAQARSHNTQTSTKIPLQLENGMLALVARLLTLNLISHALQLLDLVKQLTEGTIVHDDPLPKEPQSLSSFFSINCADCCKLETSLLLASYFSLLLKILSRQQFVATATDILPQLDPSHSHSPCAIVLRSLALGGDSDKIVRTLDSYAALLLAVCHVGEQNDLLVPVIVLQLRIYALRTRQAWWSIAAHQVDVADEVSRPLYNAMRTFRTRTPHVNDQDRAMARHAYQSINLETYTSQQSEDASGTLTQLYLLLSGFASNDSERDAWLQASRRSETAQDPASRVLNRVNGISQSIGEKCSPRDLEKVVQQLQECNTIFEGGHKVYSNVVSQIATEISSVRKTALRLLKNTRDAKLRTSLCEIIFVSAALLLTCASVARPQESPPHLAILPSSLTSDIDAVLHAVKVWFIELSGAALPSPDILGKCMRLLDLTTNQAGHESRALLLSNAYWLAYQRTSEKSADNDQPHADDLLTQSVHLMHALPVDLQHTGFYVTKIERLAVEDLAESRSREACELVARGITYHLRAGTLTELAAQHSADSNLALAFQNPNAQSLQRLLALYRVAAEAINFECMHFDDVTLPFPERTVLLEMQLLPISLRKTQSRHDPADQSAREINAISKILFDIYSSTKDLSRCLDLSLRLLIWDLCDVSVDADLLSMSTASIREETVSASSNLIELEYPGMLAYANALRNGDLDAAMIATCHAKWYELFVKRRGSCPVQSHRCDMLHALLSVSLPLFVKGRTSQARYTILSILSALRHHQAQVNPIQELTMSMDLARASYDLGLSSITQASLDRANLAVESQRSSITPGQLMQLRLLQLECNPLDPQYRRDSRSQSAFDAFCDAARASDAKASGRTAYYACQARAGHVYSRRAYGLGQLDIALHYGKESVRLYKSLLATLRRNQKAKESKMETSAMSALTVGIDKLSVVDDSPGAPRTSYQSAANEETDEIEREMLLAICHLVDLYLAQGAESEAKHHLSKAIEIAEANATPSYDTEVLERRMRLAYLSSAPPSTTDTLLAIPIKSGHLELLDLVHARCWIAKGDIQLGQDRPKEALASYMQSEAIFTHIQSLDISTVKHESVNPSKSSLPLQKAKTVQSLRAKKSLADRKRVVSKTSTVETSLVEIRTSPIDGTRELEFIVQSRKALAYLKLDDLTLASSAIDAHWSAVSTSSLHMLDMCVVQIRIKLATLYESMTSNLQYNSIAEASICMPALLKSTTVVKSPQKIARPVKSTTVKGREDDVLRLFREIADLLRSTWLAASSCSALSTIRQCRSLTTTLSMFLSTTPVKDNFPELQPLHVVKTFHDPDVVAVQRQLVIEAVDKLSSPLTELFTADGPRRPIAEPFLGAKSDELDLCKVLPRTWTVLSIGLNKEQDELCIARLVHGRAPCMLRLPLKRQNMHDLQDDEHFDFQKGRAELEDIIECSNFTCHNPVDTSVKGAKTKWWAEREALDNRLHELLVNIESIWLGGFKGVFSSHQPRPDLVARFRKSFDKILDQYLPSRNGAMARGQRLSLDTSILELFIGLGNVCDQKTDPGEQVLDLLHFVLDTLQFNGEANAYDEVDVDSMALDVLEAMRGYADAARREMDDDEERPLVLVLDKMLHAFPWESLPCTQGRSVSRVGSMLHITERLRALKRQTLSTMSERYTVSRAKGTYILNPGNDLPKTEELLGPTLRTLSTKHDWRAIVRNAPSSAEFSERLSTSNMLLYFGHGSGNQYISNRSIRQVEDCAEVIWLMGCSSGTLVENGELEAASVPLSYLIAGEKTVLPHMHRIKDSKRRKSPSTARQRSPTRSSSSEADSAIALGETAPSATEIPTEGGRQGLCAAVVATLWDVTDRDIDRFSISVGQQWGLFESTISPEMIVPPKTPARKTRGGAGDKTPAPTTRKTSSRTAKTPAKTPRRSRVSDASPLATRSIKPGQKSLSAAVAESRDVCYLRYLNGAAAVVYGIPVYLGS